MWKRSVRYMKPFLPDIPVVYFHSVGTKNNLWAKSFLTSTVDNTERFFRYVSGEYTSLTLKEYYNLRTLKSSCIRNPIVLTFDDGYLDNWLFAFPLLKKYSLKATIFVSPEFVDKRNAVRSDISESGFLSWDEMRIMESSGLIDIQSHTMTHTRYFISDKITGFHHPGNDILYPAGNLFPDAKPYHINDRGFENLLPYGYPLFEEASAVTARRVEISKDFINEVVDLFRTYDFRNYNFRDAFIRIKPLYTKYKSTDRIITGREAEEEYQVRIDMEIQGSKAIIEKELAKNVEFLCWPHGDNNSFLHHKALEAGYLMTTIGNYVMHENELSSRIPERLGIDYSSPRRRAKARFKIRAFSGSFPYRESVMFARYLKGAT
jgi:peptidoglycan/xylan/chitin deacetylase (PgdA/CDA1 family)